MYFGVAWYPEQRHEDSWVDDLALMQGAQMNVIRLGEFAWARLQPDENQWDFKWLDQAIALAVDHGFKIVLGTPTAAPPAWLTQRYPEVLRVEADGRQTRHGARYHFSFSSKAYRHFCRGIASEMAQRYGRHSSVIGWQIDNEYTLLDYGKETRLAFQVWLEKHFGEIEILNRAWALDFWSQRYPHFEAVSIPDETDHPSLRLAFKRFVSETFADYQREQLEAIRAHASPGQWITHNFMEWFPAYDHHQLAEDLDLVSYDKYVGSGHLDLAYAGSGYDLMRGLKNRRFWLMETQPGQVNWAGVNNPLDPGETRLLLWQAVAHGAEAALFWQWRTGRGGQEQYHGALLHSCGEPRPVYTEACRVGEEFGEVAEVLHEVEFTATVALLHDYDSQWALDFQPHHRDFSSLVHFQQVYRAFHARRLNLDVISLNGNLDQYKLMVLPSLHLIDREAAKRIERFVEQGGVLVVGCRSGAKDRENLWLDELPPGPLSGVLGIRVREGFALEQPVKLNAVEESPGQTVSGEAIHWAELVEAEDNTQVLARFGPEQPWLEGSPALTQHRFGNGMAFYLAGDVDESVLSLITAAALKEAGIATPFDQLPPQISLREGVSNGKRLFFLMNGSPDSVDAILPFAMNDLLDRSLRGIRELTFDGWDFRLLQCIP